MDPISVGSFLFYFGSIVGAAVAAPTKQTTILPERDGLPSTIFHSVRRGEGPGNAERSGACSLINAVRGRDPAQLVSPG